MSAEVSSGTGASSTLAAQRAHEPSMEEILASIRRIIADDQMLPLTRTGPAAAPAADVSEDIAQSSGHGTVAALVEPAPEKVEPAPVVVAEPAPEPPRRRPANVAAPARAEAPPPPVEIEAPARPVAEAPRSVRPVAEIARTAPQAEEPILSPSAGESVSSAFGALATTMFLQNTGMVEEALRDMLRPMLKQWLDDNLPVMVERLVRAEIERVARGGRR